MILDSPFRTWSALISCLALNKYVYAKSIFSHRQIGTYENELRLLHLSFLWMNLKMFHGGSRIGGECFRDMSSTKFPNFKLNLVDWNRIYFPAIFGLIINRLIKIRPKSAHSHRNWASWPVASQLFCTRAFLSTFLHVSSKVFMQIVVLPNVALLSSPQGWYTRTHKHFI